MAGTVVEENNLNQHISSLRRILGEGQGENRYIATIPGRGYRFIAEVKVVSDRQSVRPPGDDRRFAIRKPGRRRRAGVSSRRSDGRDHRRTGADRSRPLRRDRPHLGHGVQTNHQVSRDIGRELHAAYLVESSLREEGGRFRITSKLIRVRDQLQIWSAVYDSEPSSMLAFQRELGAAVAEQIRLRLSPERLRALAKRQTQNPEAYDLYLRGRHLWNQLTGPTTRRAVEYFLRATALDPNYALAWSGLADAYSSSPVHADAAPLRVWPKAREAVSEAVGAEPGFWRRSRPPWDF